ncbi:elongation factor P [Chloroflexota bacterium]
MIGAGDVKKGMVIDLDGKLCQVIDFQHVKMKHHALIKVKLKDIRLGHITEDSFPNTEKLARARLDYRPMQYLYRDGELYHFMDQENYEQISLDAEKLRDAVNYMIDDMSLEVFSYNSEVLGVKLPDTVELEVAETGPAYKGDTAASAAKPAKMETGVTIQVPYFVSTGDKIRVDTRSGLYIERL